MCQASGDCPETDWISDLCSGSFQVIYGYMFVFAYNFLQKQDRAMQMFSLYSSDQYAPADEKKNERRVKHDDARISALTFLVQT